MIFFVDQNSPKTKAYKQFREESQFVAEACDEARIEYAGAFIEDYYGRHGELPNESLLESLANLILRPYFGDKDEEYKILSGYSLERREGKQSAYNDSMERKPTGLNTSGRTKKSRESEPNDFE